MLETTKSEFRAQGRTSADRRRTAGAFPARTSPAKPPTSSAAGAAPRRDEAYPARCNPNPQRPPLDEARRELAARYVPLARSMASRFAKTWRAAGDDFMASAYLALVEAAQTYDESRGVDFATFARMRIRGALIDAQRAVFSGGWRGADEFRPRFQPLEDDSEARGSILGGRSGEPVGNDLETRDAVENWLRRLPERHAAACRHIYLDGKTQEEAADLVGCSKAAMCRIHREALDRGRLLIAG